MDDIAINNEEEGYPPGTALRHVYGVDPRMPGNVLAFQVTPEWVDIDMVRWQIPGGLVEGVDRYKAIFRYPTPEQERLQCYYCTKTRHNPTNATCDLQENDPPMRNEWVNMHDPSVTLDILCVENTRMKEKARAGSAEITILKE